MILNEQFAEEGIDVDIASIGPLRLGDAHDYTDESWQFSQHQ